MMKMTMIEKIYGSIKSRERKEQQAKAYQERMKKFKENDYDRNRE